MKIFTYWESLPSNGIPPYVTLGIARMKSVFKDNFVLLTKHNVKNILSKDVESKKWCFLGSSDNRLIGKSVESIVAKSDFIKMQYIHDHGGIWLDSDTLVIKNFLTDLIPSLKVNNLVRSI